MQEFVCDILAKLKQCNEKKNRKCVRAGPGNFQQNYFLHGHSPPNLFMTTSSPCFLNFNFIALLAIAALITDLNACSPTTIGPYSVHNSGIRPQQALVETDRIALRYKKYFKISGTNIHTAAMLYKTDTPQTRYLLKFDFLSVVPSCVIFHVFCLRSCHPAKIRIIMIC